MQLPSARFSAPMRWRSFRWRSCSDSGSALFLTPPQPWLSIQPEGFAVVGLAAFFTGVVRAPLTGIVLVTEITGSITMLLPMLGACFVAMLVPTLLREEPIYDSLREHTLRRERLFQEAAKKK